MKKIKKSLIYTTGISMFAMFFGAGNLIFPLRLGQLSEGGLVLPMIGLILTGVGIPLCGVISVSLDGGSYKLFFKHTGKYLGFIISLIIAIIIGPLGAIPRCITLSYASLSIYFPYVNIIWFSIIYSLLILFCCYKKLRIVDLLGYVLSPILLISLAAILVMSFILPHSDVKFSLGTFSSFVYGLNEGYNTMDLLGALFFSSIIYTNLKHALSNEPKSGNKILVTTLKSSLVSGVLLSIVYVGLAFVAAKYSGHLTDVSSDKLLCSIGYLILGPQGRFVICIATVAACLTTAIALATVVAEFMQKEVFRGSISYITSLVCILIISCMTSKLEFLGITRMLSPILEVLYPSLLALCLANIAHRLYGFKYSKQLFYIVLSLMLSMQLYLFVA